VLSIALFNNQVLANNTSSLVIEEEVPQLETCSEKCASHFIKPCQRGCRFYDISTWGVVEASTETNLDLCKKTCDQAYEFSDNGNDACKTGCEMANQEYNEKINKDHSTLMDEFMLSNMMNMFSVMDTIMSSFNEDISEIQITEQGNNYQQGVIIVSVLEPQSNTPFTFEDGQIVLNTEDIINDEDKMKTTLLNERVETNVQTNVNRLPSWDDSGFYRYPRNEKFMKEMKQRSYWDKFTGRVRNWWGCFTRKAGLPEIVLFLFWTSLMLLLVMSCCVNFNWRKPKNTTDNRLAVINIDVDDKKFNNSKYYQASVKTGDKIPLIDDDELLININ